MTSQVNIDKHRSYMNRTREPRGDQEQFTNLNACDTQAHLVGVAHVVTQGFCTLKWALCVRITQNTGHCRLSEHIVAQAVPCNRWFAIINKDSRAPL